VNTTYTLWWDRKSGSICYIDQTLLPNRERIVKCRSVPRLITAIRRLEIRGAPALGVAGAFGVALSATLCRESVPGEFLASVTRDAELLRATRPTAVNLGWGIDRVLETIRHVTSVDEAKQQALAEADRILLEDTACCHAIGKHGSALLAGTCRVLTHCNAGALACSSWGTALGVIRSAVSAGKEVSVVACETRPLLQGARLTAWELARDNIPVTVITDSMAADCLRQGNINAAIVGADRITADAVYNKIGTYGVAVLARFHRIPFYVAAPLSTFDLTGELCVIEERARNEVTRIGNRTFVPESVPVKNPAFDATPLSLVSAIITEKGVIQPPFTKSDLAEGRTG
jgi:methylthioribose-1-phosphate isomerase